ncbi:MAG: zinc-binding alcohol dehydrogenase family protein [Thermodesulfobacteriota bacterium]
MKAWVLAAPGGELKIEERPAPEPRPGSVLVRLAAVPLLTYQGEYLAGKLPYWYPPAPFIPGSNGVGLVEAVGAGVYHLRAGQRVIIGPHLVAGENVEEPAQMLIGLTGISPDSGPLLADWPNGTLAELALWPASAVSILEGLEDRPLNLLAVLGKFAVPLGGLLRGGLAAGMRLVVNGATGHFGSAAVLLGLALGAERIVAVGRKADVLSRLENLGKGRIKAFILSGDSAADEAGLRELCPAGAHLALDLVGRTDSSRSTLTVLKALSRGGRLVLMGGMSADLPLDYGKMLINDWEVIGNFMYRPEAIRRLIALVRSRQLDLGAVSTRYYAFRDLPAALEAAAAMRGLEATIVTLPDA